MTKQQQSPKTIDTGRAQETLQESRKAEAAAERALLRAQEHRDTMRGARENAEQQFRDSVRAVLG